MVRVLAFFSDDSGCNLLESTVFSLKMFEKMEINEKIRGWTILKTFELAASVIEDK